MSQVVRPFLPFFRPGVNTVGASGAICGLIGLDARLRHPQGGAFGASIRSVMLQCAVSTLMMSFLPIVEFPLSPSAASRAGSRSAGSFRRVRSGAAGRPRQGTFCSWSRWGRPLLAFYEVAVHGIERALAAGGSGVKWPDQPLIQHRVRDLEEAWAMFAPFT